MCTRNISRSFSSVVWKMHDRSHSRVVFDGRIKIVGNEPTVKLIRKLVLFVRYEEHIWILPTTGSVISLFNT